MANIGKSIAINGDLTGNEDMVIEGSVEGSIDLPNNQLTIGANGTTKAEIHAKSVIVVGHVVGNINGIERVEIQGTGRVEGTVTAPKLVVAEGAQLDGAIHMAGTEAALSDSSNDSSIPSNPRSTPASVPAGEVRKAG
ncbi:MAG: polymer-forming cytoskeletal protein [Myxococcota bacterium]